MPIMTKCVLRELENLKQKDVPFMKETLNACKNIVKLPCKHSGGILPPDQCIKNFVGNKNEHKVFVATNDEELRKYFRNDIGAVPLFFIKNGILIMDSPSDVTTTKFQIKEQLKMEPTRSEKKFLKAQRGEVESFVKEERLELKKARQAKTKDLLCMGVSKKMANGPNPLSIRKKSKQIKKDSKDLKVK